MTDFTEYINFIYNGNFDEVSEKAIVRQAIARINNVEEKYGKEVSQFSPEQLLDIFESYRYGSVAKIKAFLSKYLDYCIIKGNANINYVKTDSRFTLKNLSNTKTNYITERRLEEILIQCHEDLARLLVLSLYEGITFSDLLKIKVDSYDREQCIVYCGKRIFFVGKRYINLLDSVKDIKVRTVRNLKSKNGITSLKRYKDYLIKMNSEMEFENDKAFAEAGSRILRRYFKNYITEPFKVNAVELKSSGLATYAITKLLDSGREYDIENKMIENALDQYLSEKGYKAGWYTFTLANQEYINCCIDEHRK